MLIASLGSDPGITLSIYYPVVTNYTIPGMSIINRYYCLF